MKNIFCGESWVKETEHDSKWQQCNIKQLFSDEQHVQIIETLIKNDQWIIEESNRLIEILKQDFFQF